MDKSSTLAVKATPTKSVTRQRLGIVLYASVAFLYWVSLYLYVPTLPTYIQSKVDNLAVVGVVLAMYGLWQAFLRLPLGIASDWLGWRKPFIITCLILSGIGAWMMGVADDTNGLLVGRAITGLAAATWVPLLVVFNSLFPPHEVVRATALLSLISSIARVLATGVTGKLNEWGGYSLAFFLAAAAAALAALIMLSAPEQRRPPNRPSIGGIGHLITRQDVLLPAILAAVMMYVDFTTTFGFIPILSKQLGGTDVTQSLLMSMNFAVIIVGNLMATTIANRIGYRRLVYLGFGLLFMGIGLVTVAPSLVVLFVAQFCVGMAYGVNNPVLMGLSIRYVSEAERTTAMGLHQSVYAIGMFAGPWLSGILAASIGLRPMFGVTAFICLAVSLYLIGKLIVAQQE